MFSSMARIRPKIARVAEWNLIKQTNPVNSTVEAVVVRVVGLGLLCEVGARRIPGILRKREMSWNPHEQRNDTLPVGTSLHAVVIGIDDERRELVLSRKAADDGPFQKFVASYPVGSIVNAHVIRIVSEYVVALEAGIEGFIPKAAIGSLARSHPELSTAWDLRVNDRVKASIVEHDMQQRKVILSVFDAYQKFDADYSKELPGLQAKARGVLERARSRRVTAHERADVPTPDTRKLTILILDNESDILFSLKYTFEDRGHRVITCLEPASARKALSFKPDVAILDLQLGGDSADHLLPEFQHAVPGMKIFAFSGNVSPATASKRPGIIPLVKPIAPDELLALIEGRVAIPTMPDHWPLDETLDAIVNEPSQTPRLSEPSKVIVDSHLRAAIEDLYGAGIALLMLDQQRNEVVLLHEAEISRNAITRMSRQLATSAIGNVLADGSEVNVSLKEIVSPSDPMLTLLPSLRCAQMVGIPLPLESSSSRLGVFLFLPEKLVDLPKEQMGHLRNEVAALGLAFDQALFDVRVARNQRVLLAGSFVLGMTHELNNVLQPIQGNVSNLTRWENGRPYPHRSIEDYNQTLESLNRRVHQLVDLCQTILQSTRRTEGKALDLRDILLNAYEICWPSAEQGNITFVLNNIPTRAGSMRYPIALQQVFINLMLNALQHTKIFRRIHGLVQIESQYLADGRRPVIEIRITDNGSGISGDDLERVFEMYMTTRREGSGLGLYVSQLIIEGIGGSIEIEDTAKFFGTTFCVRLPAV
jgi:signal transduction histidine kinase/ActR/RegA family two-component response regulator